MAVAAQSQERCRPHNEKAPCVALLSLPLPLSLPHFCCFWGKEAGDQSRGDEKCNVRLVLVIAVNCLGEMNWLPVTETDKNPRSVLMPNHLKSEQSSRKGFSIPARTGGDKGKVKD